MSTTIDRVSEEEVAFDLAQFIKKHLAKVDDAHKAAAAKVTEDVTTIVGKGDMPGLLAKVVSEELILSALLHATENEAENAFTVFFSLIRKQPDATFEAQAQKIVSFITGSNQDLTLLRLKILANMYNMAAVNSSMRFSLLTALLNYAVAVKSSDQVLPLLKRTEQWLDEGKASKEQIRTASKVIRSIYLEHDQKLAAHKALVRQLSTFSAAEKASADTLDLAAVAATEAIQLPELFQIDHVLELPVVQQLEGSAVHSKTFQLLKIFTSDNLAAFNSFHQTNPDFLSSHGLSYDDCYKKIRLLSLTTLAAENREIPYDLIAQVLQIKPEEVESWVVAAIGAELMDARMDQLRRIVIISRATQRVFTDQQWKQLAASLNTWRDNLSHILKVIQTTTAAAAKQAERDA